MTASDLNRAISNIDGRYLDIADAPEKEIIQMSAYTNRKKIITIILAACLVMGLGSVAYAYGEQLISRVFGWGNNFEVNIMREEDGSESALAILHTDELTEPVIIQDDRMYFIVNDENIDITDLISDEEAYQYEYEDDQGITHLWLVGLLENGNPEHYGYAEYLRNAQGEWISGYSARISIEADGHTQAQWLETAKEQNGIPW